MYYIRMTWTLKSVDAHMRLRRLVVNGSRASLTDLPLTHSFPILQALSRDSVAREDSSHGRTSAKTFPRFRAGAGIWGRDGTSAADPGACPRPICPSGRLVGSGAACSCGRRVCASRQGHCRYRGMSACPRFMTGQRLRGLGIADPSTSRTPSSEASSDPQIAPVTSASRRSADRFAGPSARSWSSDGSSEAGVGAGPAHRPLILPISTTPSATDSRSSPSTAPARSDVVHRE